MYLVENIYNGRKTCKSAEHISKPRNSKSFVPHVRFEDCAQSSEKSRREDMDLEQAGRVEQSLRLGPGRG